MTHQGKVTDADGHFRRPASKFRNTVSSDPDADFPPEKDRYVLYINYGCPWAHRTNLVRSLKGLEDVVQIALMSHTMTPNGWEFNGSNGTDPADPLYGLKNAKELYLKADPEYSGRFTVPVLWDKKKETIVNNESSEIIRIFYSAFDEFLPQERRQPLLPDNLKEGIDEMNEWVYDLINNGVYKVGFASSQEAYDANVYPLFKALDRVEKHLDDPKHQPYLFGENITEADIRLYTTIVRFDPAYYTLFRCNLKMIRMDYPNLHLWLRRLYWDESAKTNGGAFKKTTYFNVIKEGYASAAKLLVPAGPEVNILSL